MYTRCQILQSPILLINPCSSPLQKCQIDGGRRKEQSSHIVLLSRSIELLSKKSDKNQNMGQFGFYLFPSKAVTYQTSNQFIKSLSNTEALQRHQMTVQLKYCIDSGGSNYLYTEYIYMFSCRTNTLLENSSNFLYHGNKCFKRSYGLQCSQTYSLGNPYLHSSMAFTVYSSANPTLILMLL